VALIRTNVSEDRIASIFRVNKYEQVQSETVSSCIDGVISQKMIIIIVTAVETSNLTKAMFIFQTLLLGSLALFSSP
jgi:hypothetical protein